MDTTSDTPVAAPTRFEELVKSKMAAGLPKADAELIARHQIEHDEKLQAETSSAGEAKPKKNKTAKD